MNIMKKSKKIITLNFDKDLINIIDEKRGDVNRSLFLNNKINKMFEDEEKYESK